MRIIATRLAALSFLLTPAFALAAPAAAHASAGPIPALQEGLITSIAAILVFLVAAVVLGTMVWPKILKGLKDRENKIRESIEAAEAAQAQAKAQLEQYNKALADARVEAQRMLETARQQQMQQATEMKAKADVELGMMKAKAIADIEAAKKQALADVYSAAVNIATQVASKVLQREVGSADNLRLAQEAVTQLTSKN
jgi:F-type H+-transporting ATPase subunit b